MTAKTLTQSARKFLDAQIKDVRSRLLKRTGITWPSPTNPSEADVRALEHEILKTTYRDLLMKKEQAIIVDKPGTPADRRAVQAARPGAPAGSAHQSRSHPPDASGRGRRVLPRRRDDACWTQWTGQTAEEGAGTIMTTNDERSGPQSAPIRRRRWQPWILVPAILGAVIGAALAARATPVYKSETLILVVPQRVPESYVRSTVTTKISDRLQAITQQILSRTRLERIIQDFDLYKEERRRPAIMRRYRRQDAEEHRGERWSMATRSVSDSSAPIRARS